MANRPKARAKRRFGTVIPREFENGRIAWRAKWREPGRRRLERWFPSKEEAEEFLAEIEKQLILGTYSTPPTTRQADTLLAIEAPGVPEFAAYARQFLDERVVPHREPATVAVYEASCKALSEFLGHRRTARGVLPAKRLAEIDETVLLDYRTWRRDRRRGGGERPVSNATLNRDQQFLVLVLNHAIR